MKLIRCIVRQERVDLVTAALEQAGASGVTVIDVRGRGRQSRPTGRYRGIAHPAFAVMAMIDVVVPDDHVDGIVDTVLDEAHTGVPGDGRVFIFPMDEGYTIRTRRGGFA